MPINELQKQTNINIQEKANLIWEIATHLVGLYKPHEYGKVILPMTVLKRFDDALAPTKQAVLDTNEKLHLSKAETAIRDGALCRASGFSFYNTSKFDFARLLADPENIEVNFDDYLKGYSDNVKEGSGRMAIIQNGSSLFTGDAGSGPSEIRRYLITSDLVEAIVQLPTDLFYNTGIATYIWLISKGKAANRMGKVQLIDASKCFVKRRKNIGNKRVDLSDDCIRLIITAYNEFDNKAYTEGALSVESKVFENDFFGYTKVTVETPVTDEAGNPVLKKGKPQPDKAKSDTEIIPLSENIDDYFAKNVLPYNSIAYMDRSKDKIGYEIPFTRLFYKFTPPRKSDDIFAEFKALTAEEADLMKEILGE